MIGRIRKILGIEEKCNRKRLDRMLTGITKEMFGLEIGPSLRPCAPKSDGYNVEIVD